MALVAWYKLNGNVLDSTVNGNHGTIVGSPTVVNDGPFGSCYLFNPDNNDRITINNLSQFIYNTPFTFSAWIKTSGLGTGQTVNGIVSLTYGTRFCGNSAGNIYIHFSSTSIGSYSITSSGININDNMWHHVCVTYDGDILKLYIDGVLNNSSVTGIVQTNTHTNNGAIGLDVNDSSKYKFNGSISDVRIYDEALSTKEIKELSKAKVLHYDFNQYQEPTTNVVTNTDLDIGWTKNYCTGILWNDIPPPEGVNSPVVSFYDAADSSSLGYWYSYGDYTPQVPGTIYTVSLYIKTRDSNFRIHHYTADNSETGRYNSEYINVPNDGKWHRIVWNSFTNPANSQSNSLSFEFYYGSSQGEAQRTWLCAPQMEAKNHATPFVNGTRTAKVYDKSGYNNNAELTVSTTPTYINESIVNKGCYEFDGTKTIIIDNPFGYTNLTQEWTVSTWAYLTTIDETQYLISGLNNGLYITYGTQQKSLLYLNGGTNDYYVYSKAGVIPVNTWFHISFVFRNSDGLRKIYINGIDESGSGPNLTSNPSGIGSTLEIGKYVKGKLADFRIYSTALSADDIKEIYQTRASIDKNGNIYCNNIEENKYVAPLVDYTSWVVGTSGAQGSIYSGDFTNYFSLNGEQACNSIIESTDPWGNLVPIWQTLGNDITSDGDGGFNTGKFSIDNTKLYRFSCWINRKVLGNGNAHFGTNGYGSVNGLYTLAGVNNTNAYFLAPLFTYLPIDEWLLMVGYIYPYTYTGTSNHPDSGYYDLNGNKVYAYTASFKFRPETTSATMREYLFYSTLSETHQLWCYPRVDICDGSEPTIVDLLNGIDYKHYQITKDLIASKGINKNSSILSNEFSEVGITEGLVAYYPLNGDAKDYSGNNNHGTVYGAIKASGIAGKKCYSFDGVNYIYASDNLGTLHTSFSISLWTKAIPKGNFTYIIHRGGSSIGPSIYHIGENNTGNFIANVNGTYANMNTGVPVDTDWHHIVLTYDGNIEICYIDDVEKVRYTVGVITNDWTDSIVGIAASNPVSTSRNFQGKIQDIRIYNRALSDKEIGILYNTFNPNINKTLQINKENIIYTKGNIKEV